MDAIFSILVWFAQGITSFIFLQMLYFKFTGVAESIEIFSAIGIEPWGRYFVGCLELVAAILLLIPVTSWYGAFLSVFIIVPALVVHIVKIGFVIQNDRGVFFGLALSVLVLSIALLIIRWSQGPFAFKTA